MMTYDKIPAELQECPHWINWRYVTLDDGKITKRPVDAKTGKYGDVTQLTICADFATAIAGLHKWDSVSGIGFVFNEHNPYAGVDLDDPKGDVKRIAAYNKIIAAFPSYTEYSPSGCGVHIIVRGNIQGSRKFGVEAYSVGRYFTFTGNVWRDLPITDCQPMLDELQAELQPTRHNHTIINDQPATESNQAIIDRALAAKNGDKVRELLRGDGSRLRGDTSPSAIDLALVNIIQFYTKNVEQIEYLWRLAKYNQTAERQAKIDRTDYRLRTIRLAFDRDMPPIEIDHAALQASWGASSAATPISNDNDGGNRTLAQLTHQQQMTTQHLGAAATYVNTSGPTLPPGLMGYLAQFIYDAAPRQVKEIAIAGAIGWMAGVAGKAFNINGAGLNMYVAILASSGSGKEAISGGYSAIQQAIVDDVKSVRDFIGPANFASATGLLRHVEQHKSSVSVVGEFGKWLDDMTGPRPVPVRAQIKTTLTELYGKSGKRNVFRASAYADKANDILEIDAPAFSIVGESTPSTFYRNINDRSIEDGFLPRFIVIEYDGDNQYINEAAQYTMMPTVLRQDVAEFVTYCHNLNVPPAPRNNANGNGVDLMALPSGPVSVAMTPEAHIALRLFSNYCTDVSNKYRKQHEGLMNIWARVYVNVAKLAALVAVGCSNTDPRIDLVAFEWARDLVLSSVHKLTAKIDKGEVAGSHEARQAADTLKAIQDYYHLTPQDSASYRYTEFMVRAHIVSHKYLSGRTIKLASFKDGEGDHSKALARIITKFIDEGILSRPFQAGDARMKGNMCSGSVYAITLTSKD